MDSTKYTCECCGEQHEGWPALTYISPDNYSWLSDNEKDEIALIDEDFCVIKRPDHVGRFIRCVLFQEVNDHCEDLEYGLWVSLSEKSFQDYLDNFDNKEHETQYFGWLSNGLKGYTFSESVPTTVVTQRGNNRPVIFPHKEYDHPFVKDFYEGITKTEAENRIQDMINTSKQNA
ncbi:DUF2199 domain-containing protein [Flavobacterium poyangense]|uniref:DUF2199 domain-containing protein n=1 Tax=Flavobacterium poyangense TaxID=2204302 RepID=UPI001423FFC1|nr:DUF2199 domain-containing protein [Flavobacterium sp. JXAS1]